MDARWLVFAQGFDRLGFIGFDSFFHFETAFSSGDTLNRQTEIPARSVIGRKLSVPNCGGRGWLHLCNV